MGKTLKSFLITFLIFFVIIFIATFGLLHGYFEQDEWMGIAEVMHSYNYPWWYIYLPWVHFSPLAIFVWSTLYQIFHLQAQYYFLAELAIHSACSALVFILTSRITKNKIVASIGALLFLLNSRAHQAFTHLAIFHTTDSAMFLILLFFVYLTTITKKIFSFKNSLILLIIFLCAIGFREEGFIIIPSFVAYLVAFDRDKINKENFKHFLLLGAGLFFYILIRVFAQRLNPNPVPMQFQVTGVGSEYNLVTLPIKFIVQNLIYAERIALFFVEHVKGIYPNIDGFFTSHAPVMDSAFFYIFGIILFIIAIWIWHVKPKNIGPVILFISTWVLANAFMLSFVGRHISVVEPRYLYYSSFPVFCLIGIFIFTTFKHNSNILILDIFKKIGVVILLLTLFITSILEIRVAVKRQVDDGVAKKKILSSLVTINPSLSKNTIFYIKCKTNCHRNIEDFGISNENVLPFSSGPGMVFLVKYAVGHEKEWGPFLTQDFLFNTFAQGYEKHNGYGYGYFTDKNKLKNILSKYKISKNVVIALEYNEDNFTLKDISNDFRKSLQ